MDFNTLQVSRTYGETPWHRNWKKVFPPSFREVSFADRGLGELHRADVYAFAG